jgi:RHS repeat-associated protein
MFGQTYETVQPNPTSGDTALGPITTETYDADGDLLSESLPDPTTGAAGGPTTTFSYDAFGDQISTTDPMLNTSFDVYDLDGRVVQEQDPSGALTSFSYDSFGNEVSQSLPDPSTGAAGGPTTIFTFDADHQTLSLTDPDSNATFWTYTGDGQVATQSQIVALGYNSDGSINTTTAVSSNEYDLAGDLAESVDADGRAIVFSYSTLGQETGETWYPTAADATAGTGSDGSESFSYDVMGNIATAADTAVVSGTSETIAAYGYQYQGRKVMSQTVNLNGLSPQVTLASGYDYNGNRTSFSATIGSTADFLNSYSYDAIGEVTGITQAEQSSASSYNTFAPKGVSFTYNYDALPTGEQLFNSTDIATAESSGDTSNLVATSTDSYDLDSRLTELTYKAQSGGATLASYSYGLDDNGLATSMVYTSNTSAWNEKDTYTNDRDGQLTGTSYAIGQTSGETSTYETTTSDAQTLDSNGNRTQSSLPDSITSAVGAGNRVLYDGTYFYRYDVAGNRIAKFKSDTGLLDSSATDITIYKWNEENELTAVTTYEYYSNYSSATDGSVTDFGYDPFRQMVSTTLAGGSPEYFMYDGTNVALILNASGGVIEREFSGPAADQYFASENGSTGVVNWLLPDAHGTVRDVAQFTPGTDDGPGTTAVVDHVFFTSAGAVTSQTSSSAADQSSFGYDGMWQGAVAATKLNNDDQRWYDAVDSIFANQDPLGFGGGQTNTEEFCGNSPTNATDPSGLMANFSPVNPASWGPLKGTDIGGVGPGSCGCAEGKPVGLMDTPSDSGGGIPVLGNPSNSTWGQTDKRLASGFGNFVLGGTDGRLVSNPPTKEDFAKGDAIENKDANGKTYYYYPHEDNLPKGYKLFAYQTKRGSAFYVQAPDGAYVHRCAYLHGINEMDQWDGHPGGYWGSSHNKNGDEWITYAYDPKTHKLRLRVYDGDPAGAPTPGKLIREQTLDKAPSDPEGLPYPDQVPKINAPAK